MQRGEDGHDPALQVIVDLLDLGVADPALRLFLRCEGPKFHVLLDSTNYDLKGNFII